MAITPRGRNVLTEDVDKGISSHSIPGQGEASFQPCLDNMLRTRVEWRCESIPKQAPPPPNDGTSAKRSVASSSALREHNVSTM